MEREEAMAARYQFNLMEPIGKLSPSVRDIILYGTKGEKLKLHYDRPNGRGELLQAFEGIIPNLERRYHETQSDAVRKELEEYMSSCPCLTVGWMRRTFLNMALITIRRLRLQKQMQPLKRFL